jgi:hypothetical protein
MVEKLGEITERDFAATGIRLLRMPVTPRRRCISELRRELTAAKSPQPPDDSAGDLENLFVLRQVPPNLVQSKKVPD